MAEALVEPEDPSIWKAIPRSSFSRVLFSNPVCLLTTWDEAAGRTNVMTVTWLTAASNHGQVLLSLNDGRHSLSLIDATRRFVLNVATEGMEELLRQVGSCSGASVDKTAQLGLRTCPAGLGARVPASADVRELSKGQRKIAEAEAASDQAHDRALDHEGVAAHLVCSVLALLAADTTGIGGHTTVVAQIELGYARAGYLAGATFAAVDGRVAATLSFLGSQQFARTTRVGGSSS